ncbi:MAG: cell division protein FtsQ [Candidatus Pedobacter colombiensis]|uniref:Cell division protein FtsQ n=1 Tax=Candidatus Pedobacter colombiensis TaxID=3121371 RepID=A0AAJ6B6H5_9SPHI|nr:cell division protein FtsQ [Pedobacter sp.]WEK18436.1 MAG: cell division protein FtsQ [Pedobacter sp.]
MLKRINWKPVFKCFAWIVCLSGLVVLMSFVDGKKKKLVCTNVKILIPGADNFIEREEIDAILKQSQGSLIGQNLAGINLQRIEKNIIANPYIAYATVYADMNGIIQIEIKQRQPILRMINLAGQDYYIDSNGLKMPVSPNFTANVLAANGDIMERFSGRVDTLSTQLAIDLYKVALYVKRDTLWDAQIEQLYINSAKDIELIPRVGNQRIILGTADSLETKMRNLLAFYKKAIPKVGWNTYKTINVKYTNQIVCEKNKIDSITGEVIKDRIIDTAKQSRKLVDSVVRKQIVADIQQDAGSKKEKIKTDTRKNN